MTEKTEKFFRFLTKIFVRSEEKSEMIIENLKLKEEHNDLKKRLRNKERNE
jgi:hypothetical protein